MIIILSNMTGRSDNDDNLGTAVVDLLPLVSIIFTNLATIYVYS